MKNNRYFIVGLFIIVTTTIMLFIGFWLAFGLKNIKYNIYMAKFYESVNGLNSNAPINYNGVNVGKVQHIEIDKKNPSIVIVTMQIQEGTPIFTNTFASLAPQGITGQIYISLSLKGDKPATAVSPKQQPPYPIVKTQASLLTSIVDQISIGTKKITEIADRINQIISEENVKKTNDIIHHLQTLSKTIANNNNNIQQSMNALHRLLNNIANSSTQFNQVIKSFNQTSKSITDTSKQVNQMAKTLQNQTLQALNNSLLPQFHQTLNNINQNTLALNKLLTTLNQNPSVLIRGQITHQDMPGVINA